jgi:hypothetical protein
MDKSLSPIHPGEILLEDFMKPLGLTKYRLAQSLGITPIHISQIVNWKVLLAWIQPCVWRVILAQVQQSGFVYRFVMLWKLQNGSWANASIGKSKFVNNRMFAPDGNGNGNV